MNRFDYSRIEHLMPTLDRYIQNHIPTGGFLEAVLSNDLRNALDRADDENLWLLPIIAGHGYSMKHTCNLLGEVGNVSVTGWRNDDPLARNQGHFLCLWGGDGFCE